MGRAPALRRPQVWLGPTHGLRRAHARPPAPSAARARRLEHLAAYVLELALPEYAALQWLPSQLAAGAVALARGWLGAPAWSPTLAHYARYEAAELRPVAAALHALAQRAACRATYQLPAVREKYAAPARLCVSSLAPPAAPPALG